MPSTRPHEVAERSVCRKYVSDNRRDGIWKIAQVLFHSDWEFEHAMLVRITARVELSGAKRNSDCRLCEGNFKKGNQERMEVRLC